MINKLVVEYECGECGAEAKVVIDGEEHNILVDDIGMFFAIDNHNMTMDMIEEDNPVLPDGWRSDGVDQYCSAKCEAGDSEEE